MNLVTKSVVIRANPYVFLLSREFDTFYQCDSLMVINYTLHGCFRKEA
jgi:hypothetical protein